MLKFFKNGKLIKGVVGTALMSDHFRKVRNFIELVESDEDSIYKATSRAIIKICSYYKKHYENEPSNLIIYRGSTGARELNNIIEEEIEKTRETLL